MVINKVPLSKCRKEKKKNTVQNDVKFELNILKEGGKCMA